MNRHKDLSFSGRRLQIFEPFELTEQAQEEQIVFVHPPKTGGTNLSFLATAWSKTQSGFPVHRFAVPRIEGQSPNLITYGWEGGLAAARESLRCDPLMADDFRLVSGHFPYGLHEMTGLPTRYVGLIRNPVEREISALNFDYQRGFVDEERALIYLNETMINNPQTRIFAGGTDAFACDSNIDMCDIYDRARKNIRDNFTFVAPTSAAFEAAQALAGLCDMPAFAMPRTQVTGVKLITDISPALRDSLTSRHLFDDYLFADGVHFWEEWKSKNVKGTKPPQDGEKILTLLPDFARTKTPVFMSREEIEAYNDACDDDLFEQSQASDTPFFARDLK
ncbi:MAG: hypothetical protein AB7E85_04060 [Pseudobdellovibrionaceae bacterium]